MKHDPVKPTVQSLERGEFVATKTKQVSIPPFEELIGMKTKIDLKLEGMVGDENTH